MYVLIMSVVGLWMCIVVNIYTYIFIYVYTQIYVYSHMYICMYLLCQLSGYECVLLLTYIHTYLYMYIHKYMYIHICIYVCTYYVSCRVMNVYCHIHSFCDIYFFHFKMYRLTPGANWQGLARGQREWANLLSSKRSLIKHIYIYIFCMMSLINYKFVRNSLIVKEEPDKT